jgi:hypothetical protein
MGFGWGEVVKKRIEHLKNLETEDRAAREYYAKLERAEVVGFFALVGFVLVVYGVVCVLAGKCEDHGTPTDRGRIWEFCR